MRFASELNLRQKGLILVSVPLFFQILFFIVFAQLIATAESEFDKQLLSQNILIRMQELENSIVESISTFAAAAFAFEEVPKETVESLGKRIDESNRFFDWFLTVRPERAESIRRSREIVRKASDLVPELNKHFGVGSKTPVTDRFKYLRGDLSGLLVSIMSAVTTMLEDEQKIQVTFPEQGRRLEFYIATACGAAIAANLLLAIFLAKTIGQDMISRLGQAADNAKMIAIDKPLPAAVEGSDEIAGLDAAVRKAALLMQETRQRERSILEQASQGMFSADSNLKLTGVSLPAARLIGYSEDDLLGLPFLELLEDSERDGLRKRLCALLENGGDDNVEVNLVRRDKTRLPVLLSLKRAKDAQTIVLVAHDITERKALEALRQQFVSMISHDIRTPLASAGGALQLISVGAKGPLSDDVQARILKAERLLRSLSDLVQSVLDLERLESGKISLSSQCLSLVDIVESALHNLSEELTALGIQVEKRVRDAAVIGDSRWTVDAIAKILLHELRLGSKQISLSSVIKDKIVELSVESSPSILLPDEIQWLDDSQSKLGISLSAIVVGQLDGTMRTSSENGVRLVTIGLPRFSRTEDESEAV